MSLSCHCGDYGHRMDCGYYTPPPPLIPQNDLAAQMEELDRARLDAACRSIEWQARAEKAERALARGVEVASQFMNTGRGDLDGWIEANCAAFHPSEEASDE